MTEPRSLDHDAASPAAPGTAAGSPEQPPATPRWVKAAAAVVGLLVVLVLAKLSFSGGMGGHGPGMHAGLGAVPAADGDAAADAVGSLPLP